MPLNCGKYPTSTGPTSTSFHPLARRRASGSPTTPPSSPTRTNLPPPNSRSRAMASTPGIASRSGIRTWPSTTPCRARFSTEYAFFAQGPGTSTPSPSGTAPTCISRRRATPPPRSPHTSSAQINGQEGGSPADPEVAASSGSDAWVVRLERMLDTGATVPVSASGNFSEELHHIQASTVCRALRDQINGAAFGIPRPSGSTPCPRALCSASAPSKAATTPTSSVHVRRRPRTASCRPTPPR